MKSKGVEVSVITYVRHYDIMPSWGISDRKQSCVTLIIVSEFIECDLQRYSSQRFCALVVVSRCPRVLKRFPLSTF